MRPYPPLLTEIALFLEAGPGETLQFRRPVEECLDRVIDRLAGLPEGEAKTSIRALLGLEIVLRNERASAEAADALNAAFRRSPAAVRALLALEREDLGQKVTAAKLIAKPAAHEAPQLEAPTPAGSVRASSLGNTGLDLERLRARAEPRR